MNIGNILGGIVQGAGAVLGMIPGVGTVGRAALGALGNAIGGGISQDAAQKQNFEQAKELMQYQYDLQRQQFDYTNDYNSPQKQMQRLHSAGLNPNLVYGSGNAVGNSASMPSVGNQTSPKVQALQLAQQSLEFQRLQKDIQLADSQIQYQNEQTRGQRILNDKEETGRPYWDSNALTESLLLDYKLAGTEFENTIKQTNSIVSRMERAVYLELNHMDYYDGMLVQRKIDDDPTPFERSVAARILQSESNLNYTESQIESIGQAINESIARCAYMAKQGAVLDQEYLKYVYENRLRQLGINPNDSLGWRMIGLFLEYLGPEKLKSVLKGIGKSNHDFWKDFTNEYQK